MVTEEVIFSSLLQARASNPAVKNDSKQGEVIQQKVLFVCIHTINIFRGSGLNGIRFLFAFLV